ncbi:MULTISPECIES: ABC transporter substrate-binding protein [unclassified Mycolicibacterium]|uniref:ABC transporter substrate-binding protein n=1 Tax=unclassified Mycolicibacterium TaxID=2636767 RepID=UPI0012DC9449|nr:MULTISPECIES: extracellular solute-binding protein [unclassified Mycolicibacterium]MUL81135.1 extracellular solute-binding protein [Mycolicibacterium sp. CBMA 329]MUL86901.1 extracellular solute-binding protein [Mycolicibacterium sp. CBMA 331]MUL98815.1 extracellular solute-binding protein [Mycolicibacterium sp. CBMA 334]MUM30137.1 extracellular solute-binding protein [Mycolicibacterium sp. CBMA 295]MUM37198.1 extracellular solute-binding protein [Mycolicibacterium sp. CBMA 247]
MKLSRVRWVCLAGSVALTVTALTGCGSGSSSSSSPASTATSAADLGGMDELIAAAKKEGKVNAIALPRDWANYGAVIDAFKAKYGIVVEVENPDASSQDELNAVSSRKGQDRSPDVIDVGHTFGIAAAQQGLLAPYKVAAYNDIPEGQKDAEARWYNDFGGYVSIGCDEAKARKCPTSFAELLDPRYKGMVALTGNPTQSASAFAAVYAAALANGGSLDDIKPGLEYFRKLTQAGNFNPVDSTPATIQKGETPISVNWDYLNAGYTEELSGKGVKWQVAIPTDSKFSQYYSQAIAKWAPHPAAARLWQEFLYSPEGQNLWLKGFARPVLMPAMAKAGTLDTAAAAKLPKVDDAAPAFPTEQQSAAAKDAVSKGWGAVVAP